MEIWHHSLEAAPRFGPCVVTLGVFDGVHAGHKRVLEDAAARARKAGVPAVVVTFDPHPAIIVSPEQKPRLLMTLAQRLKAFERAGMDLVWVIPFSRSFSELSPRTFLHEVQRALAPVEIHMGKSFRFGRDRAGTLETLRIWSQEAGCKVLPHALRAPDGGHLSSTRIREALDQGNVALAAELLGHPYALTGVVVDGERRGRHLGFPTANLAWEQEQLPAFGVYVTSVTGLPTPKAWLGLTNVGEKPTFDGLKLTVETHLPGFQGDLYGSRLELSFLHRLRGEQRFSGVQALQEQIEKDVQSGLQWWEAHLAQS